MDYAIIAAGEGSRLKKEGIESSKPMVRIHGVPLIERLIRIFASNKAERIFILVNEYSADLQHHLETLKNEFPITVYCKTTESSLHSFYELLKYVQGNEVCLATVDSIFDEREFSQYIHEFLLRKEVDGLMAATDYVDDESPLYISVDNTLQVQAYHDTKLPGDNLVSGGIYCLRRSVFPLVNKAVQSGMTRMRNFQKMLVENKKNIVAYPFNKIIDVDHVSDIEKAELFIKKPEMA